MILLHNLDGNKVYVNAEYITVVSDVYGESGCCIRILGVDEYVRVK